VFWFYLQRNTLFYSVICIYYIIIRTYSIILCLKDIHFHPFNVTPVREVNHCDTSNHIFFSSDFLKFCRVERNDLRPFDRRFILPSLLAKYRHSVVYKIWLFLWSLYLGIPERQRICQSLVDCQWKGAEHGGDVDEILVEIFQVSFNDIVSCWDYR
jgi:hypothetical protein